MRAVGETVRLWFVACSRAGRMAQPAQPSSRGSSPAPRTVARDHDRRSAIGCLRIFHNRAAANVRETATETSAALPTTSATAIGDPVLPGFCAWSAGRLFGRIARQFVDDVQTR